jgi:hypothetical protein
MPWAARSSGWGVDRGRGSHCISDVLHNPLGQGRDGHAFQQSDQLDLQTQRGPDAIADFHRHQRIHAQIEQGRRHIHLIPVKAHNSCHLLAHKAKHQRLPCCRFGQGQLLPQPFGPVWVALRVLVFG